MVRSVIRGNVGFDWCLRHTQLLWNNCRRATDCRESMLYFGRGASCHESLNEIVGELGKRGAVFIIRMTTW